MSEFGLPTRSATEDANEGIVNPPSVKITPRTAITSKVKDTKPTRREAVVGKIGANIGGALQNYMEKGHDNRQEQRAMDAALRQGTKTAVNDIDANNKRSPWERFVFGDSVEYRAAQQRATQNLVGQEYLKQTSVINEYSGETPSVYQAGLRDQLDKMLEPHAGDPETRQLITKSWMEASSKLASKQYANNHAYNLMQQRETESDRTQLMIDTATIEMQQATGPESMGNAMKYSKDIFSLHNRPAGMSPEAKQEVLLERVNENLRRDNIGAYNLLKLSPLYNDLEESELKKIEAAVNVYDKRLNESIERSKIQAEYNILDSASIQEAEAIWDTFDTDLTALARRSSMTEKSIRQLEDAKLWQRKLRLKGFLASSKNAEKAERFEDAVNSWGVTDAGERSAIQSQLKNDDLTETDRKKSFDVYMTRQIGQVTGNTEISTEDAVRLMLTNKGAAKVAFDHWKNVDVESQMMKDLASAVIAGNHQMRDKDGKYDPSYKNLIETLSIFEQDSKFQTLFSNDEHGEWKIIKQGIASGRTAKNLDQKIKDYNDTKGKTDLYNIQWQGYLSKKGKGFSKRDEASQIVQQITGQFPSGHAVGEYTADLIEHVRTNRGDIRMGIADFKDQLMNADVNYRGRRIPNGKPLNDVVTGKDSEGNNVNLGFNTYLDGVQRPDVNLMSGFLTTMMGVKDENGKNTPFHTLAEVPGYKIYTVSGQGGYFITAPDAKQNIHIREETMKEQGKYLFQRNRFNDMVRDSQAKAAWKAFEKNKEGLLQDLGKLP